MAKKPISQKRADREKQENLALQRVFNVFLLGIAAEVYLFIVYRNYIMGTPDSLLIWHSILRWGMLAGLVLLVAGAAVAWVKRERPKLRSGMILMAAIGLFLTVSGWIMTSFYNKGVTTMCILVPVLTLLGLVFFLFQRECFLSTVVMAGALFTVWVCGSGLDSSWRIPVIIGSVAAVVILAVLAYLVRRIQKDGGKFRDLRVFTAECDYRVIYAVLAVSAVAIVAVLAFQVLSYYLLWALGILLFAEMVYYTSKLM